MLFRGEVRVLQGKEGAAGGNFLFRLSVDGGHNAGIGRGLPGAVDVEAALPQGSAVLPGDRHALTGIIARVLHGHHQGAVQTAFHPAGNAHVR